jgi:hypothetical protein
MDSETCKATTQRKTVTGQRTADDCLNYSSYEMREKARDLRIRASAIVDQNNRHTMLGSAVDYERRANQLDKQASYLCLTR